MKEGKGGDSLKLEVTEDGKVTLEWDKNDPHWSFLGQLSDDQINEFIQTALEDDKLRSAN